MPQTRVKERSIESESSVGLFTDKGICPVDGASMSFVVFDEKSIGLGLLSESFPYMTRMCTCCLSASNDNDFFSTARRACVSEAGDGSEDEENAIKQAHVYMLPVRLAAVRRTLDRISSEALALLVEDRRTVLESALDYLIRRGVPTPSPDTVATLVQYGLNLLAKNDGLDDLVGKLVNHPGFVSRLGQDSGLGALVRAGADPSMAAQASIYGALLSVFDTEGLVRLAEPPALRQETALLVALLHQELVRLTVCARPLGTDDGMRAAILSSACETDPDRLVGLVEEHLQAEVTKRTQGGYDCLSLGLSYYRSVMITWCLLNLREAAVDERLRALTPTIWKAILFLELSLLAERYPQFTRTERIVGLNVKGRLKVPFLYGEFGVRHILCFLYNELGKLRQEAGEVMDLDVVDLAAEIKGHWLAVNERFCEIEFGGCRNPKTVQVLVPRLIAFATTCFHKDTADLLKQTVLDNRARFYGRYMAEGLALASSLS